MRRATLRVLTRFWGAEPEGVAELAASLGADVPACLRGVPAEIFSTGEDVRPVPALPARRGGAGQPRRAAAHRAGVPRVGAAPARRRRTGSPPATPRRSPRA